MTCGNIIQKCILIDKNNLFNCHCDIKNSNAVTFDFHCNIDKEFVVFKPQVPCYKFNFPIDLKPKM